MTQEQLNPEIILGARVVISKRLGVSELEFNNIDAHSGLGEANKENQRSLQLLDEKGLIVGSGGIVEKVYITGYSNVLFNPTKKVTKPFSHAVPTACLSVI